MTTTKALQSLKAIIGASLLFGRKFLQMMIVGLFVVLGLTACDHDTDCPLGEYDHYVNGMCWNDPW
ncbi:MAG: hypothetical protein ACR2PJ_03600 [Pseudomonadales bacterium]